MPNLPNHQEFPQFSQAEMLDETKAVSKSLISDFRFHPAIQNRPHTIQAVEKEKHGILLTLETSARSAVLSYTHETSLHLYKPADPTVTTVYLHIHFWTDEIFRVVFSKEKEIINRAAGLPADAQMLIAKPEAVDFTLAENEKSIVLFSGKVEMIIDKETLQISARFVGKNAFFSQSKQLFRTGDIHDLSLAELDGDYACFECLELETDELIYGLGERFDSLTRNGRTVDFYNKDAVGTTSRRSYFNIPFYLSTKGYGLFLNSSAQTDWQIGTTDLSALQFAVLDHQIDYFVIPGTPKEILKGYCTLTGFSQLPPLWSFGLWMSRNSYVSWDVVDEIAEKIRENDIPCDVLHLDTAWFNRDWNCDLKFSEERFPHPKEHMEKYSKDGFKISLWQYNFIPPNDDNTHYHEAVANGYLSKNADGQPYQLPDSCQGSWVKDVTIDFSNPDARKWYGEKIAELIRLGAAAIKTDFGEGIAEEALYQNIDGKHFHNLYSLVYNHVVFNYTKSVSGENIVWARSGTAGSQRYPLHWGGDSQCTFEALAGTLKAALSLGLSGIPYFSHDIGGFLGTPTDELYIRWAQLGFFSSHSRCHGVGNTNYREPWRFSKETCDIFRFYDKLRYSLMPYIYEEAEKCTHTGLPMMRSLYLEYPEDRNVRHLDDEYLFGDQLLVAPILKPLSKTNIREIYLPKGVWFDYFTKERIESSGMWIKREVDLRTLPLYVKEGTVLKYCSANTHLQNGMGEIIRTEEYI